MSKTDAARIDDTLDYVRTAVSSAAKDVLQTAWNATTPARQRQISSVLSFGWRGFGKDKQSKTDRRRAARAWLLTLALMGGAGSTTPKTVAYIRSNAKSIVSKPEATLRTWLRAKLPPNPPPRRAAASAAPVATSATPVTGPAVMGMAHPTRTRARNDEQIGDNGKVYRVYRQSKSHSCGPTCCRIVVMNALPAKDYSEDELRDFARALGKGGYVPYHGTNMGPLVDVLKACGHGSAAFYEGCNEGNLRWAVQSNGATMRPAIIRIQWHGAGGHFVVVADCHNNRFTVIDPLNGGIRSLTAAELNAYNGGRGTWDGRIVSIR